MYYFQLMGGMGNQMFQYAVGRSLSIARSIPVKFFFFETYPSVKRSMLLDKFSLDMEMADEGERSRIETLRSDLTKNFAAGSPRWVMMEKSDFVYDAQLFHAPDDAMMIGYWQNELYFRRYAGEIRRFFSLKAPFSQRFQAISDRIGTKRCPVSIHIRRGDYATHPAILAIHGLCPIQYYTKALQLLQDRWSDIHLFIFSDDIDWVKIHFDVRELPHEMIEPSHTNPQEDLVLMSRCQHHIIANSSFSWWGAWLNPSPNKMVIAPRQWMTAHYDPPVICQDWTGI